MVGEVVAGRYALEERLGAGGSSAVWRALDEATGEHVAVKVLHLDVAESPEALARFDREARLLAAVVNGNVVALRDRGEQGGRPFLVFDLVDGSDLRERLRQDGVLPIAEAIAIGCQVANGLAAAHACRCVHRDLKPGNILVGTDGVVRVCDFGIARAIEEPGLTQPGRVLGTGEYVSPEQALGRPVGPRSDLYGLGVVLYEMVAGRPPFRGSGFADVAARHVRAEPPDLAEQRPGLPSGLVALIATLLAKSPDERPDDAATVRDALRTMLGGLAGPDQPLVVAVALSDLLDAEVPTGSAEAFGDLGELAPWENLTPAGMEYAIHDGDGSVYLESAPYRVPASARENSGSLRWAAVLALGLAVGGAAIVIGISDRGSASGTSVAIEPLLTAPPPSLPAPPATTASPPAQALTVESAITFDPPPGDGSENDDQAQDAVDGDPATFWETETYRSDPDLAKGGVGLVIGLQERARVTAVEVLTPAPGFTAALYTSALAAPPTALADWTPGATARAVTASRQRLRLARPARARFVLVWITRLTDGETGGFTARIGEARPIGG